MKPVYVSDLIKNTEIYENPNRPAKVDVSILHPSYNGFRDGSVVRMIESVKALSSFSWELIIVDDSSNDGSTEYFKSLVDGFPQIMLLRHERNVGLPAISEYEAYTYSRGGRIAFAFDDIVFKKIEFERMYAYAVQNDLPFVHGLLDLLYIDSKGREQIEVIGAGSNSESLLHGNRIGNSCVLVQREVLEDIGLFDPHVSLSRLCDWDLWIRISKKYTLNSVPYSTSREHGALRSNSLCNSYPLDPMLVSSRMSVERNHLLKPNKFFQIDTVDTAQITPICKSQILEVANMHYRNEILPDPPLKGLILGEFSMSCHLSLDALNHKSYSLDYYYGEESQSLLMAESCKYDFVIVSRTLAGFYLSGTLKYWRQLGIPIFYMIDDNFPLLSESDYALAWYGTPDFQRALGDLTGLISTSSALSNFFSVKYGIKNICTIPICAKSQHFDQKDIPSLEKRKLRIAFFGGNHRNYDDIVLAIKNSFEDHVEIYAAEDLRGSLKQYKDIKYIERITSPHQFLTRWRGLSPDIVIHPRSTSKNANYKTTNALLVSYLIGAVPIVYNEGPYSNIDWGYKIESSMQLKSIIESLWSDRALEKARQNLHTFCETEYSPERSSNILSDFLEYLSIKPSRPSNKLRFLVDILIKERKVKEHITFTISLLIRDLYRHRLMYTWLHKITEKVPLLKRLRNRVRANLL